MTWLGVDTPTLDQLVVIAPLAAAHLISLGALIWLADRSLRVLDRELARNEKACDTPGQVVDQASEAHTVTPTKREAPS